MKHFLFVILVLASFNCFAQETNQKHPPPTAVFSYEPFCFGDSIHFTNLSKIYYNFEWTIVNSASDTIFSSTEFEPAYLFEVQDTFVVTLKADNGHQSQKSITLIVDGDLHVDFDFTMCVRDSVAFNSQSVCAAYVRWNFGDGTTSTEHNLLKRFDEPGTYTVMITGYNSDSSQSLSYATKVDIPVPYTPEPNFTIEHHYAPNYDSVVFTPENLNGQNYLWFFGDGTNSMDTITSHIYQRSKQDDTLEVSLMILDLCGQKQVIQEMIILGKGTGVGIEEQKMDNIKVFPNPANEQINVLSANSIINLKMIDISGKTLIDKKNIAQNINLMVTQFPEGIYFLQLISSEKNHNT